ncbi:MAG: EamA family transporter [Alphaproteobacteria bacterium]|nr:EamA family transporter [Alphaproteobacteria bacterium]MDD9920623.1 EamA family transporter [Alphaproteobacteria bacterium]
MATNAAFLYGAVGMTASIIAAAPALAAVLAWVFLKERLALMQNIGVVGILIGLVLIAL